MSNDFSMRLRDIQRSRSSLLCVGLDPDPERLPPHLLRDLALPDAVLAFNLALIEATAAFACAFKLNFAFYEALGPDGWRVLSETVRYAGREHVTIADGKRGDIGNSARFYAESVFERLGFDACTVAPYMGADAVRPFLQYAGRCAFALVRTSNTGGTEIQELEVAGEPLYLTVAERLAQWGEGTPGRMGFVVGATNTGPVSRVRERHPDAPLLIPGVGAQGGDAHALLKAASSGRGPVLVNSSRQIIYASSGNDFSEAAAREAETLRALLSEAARAGGYE